MPYIIWSTAWNALICPLTGQQLSDDYQSTVYMHARITEQWIGLLHVQGVLFEMWVETNSIYCY